jgi:mitochondrial fission protein ELM1
LVIDSRRTPKALRDHLNLPANAKYVHWRDTQPSWLTHQLSRSGSTWVTPDSASMVYEALSFSGRVGVIGLRPRWRSNKLAHGIRRLHALGYNVALAEHKRCAKLIMQRWFSAMLEDAGAVSTAGGGD